MHHKEKKKRKHLSIMSRIIIAFVVVIVLPILLMSVILLQPLSSRLRHYGLNYGVTDLSYSGMYNSAVILDGLTKNDILKIKQDMAEDPSQLESNEYLYNLNNSLKEKNAFAVVKKGEDIIFNGSTLSDEEIAQKLPDPDSIYQDDNGDWITLRSDLLSIVKDVDVSFEDGTKGSVIIFTNLNQIWPGMRSWLRDLAISCILVLALTAVFMGIWLYFTMAEPLAELKKAAKNIRDGNLDYHVEGSGAREMQEAFEGFEEMRIRLKESAEERIEIDKNNKEFISNISHDLKTPITTIRGYCEGLLDNVADTEEKREKYIKTIYNKANEMNNLINELSIFSKIDTGRIPYTFTKINVTDFFDDCAEEVGLELENKGIKLEYDNSLIDKNTQIIGDVEQLKRVINNIITNSVKYMNKENKVIKIRILDKDDFIQAEFEDNGKGIAKEDVSKIFDRFYRTDASRNSARGGSGIGLSIVKKILEDHGGNVWASSVENEWTTIHFVIRKHREA